ncbi:MAG: hypothetical protein EA422_15610 [Gemmatimonadales bacterium]|nr:MAG: hypothetical protein EA422_15610 [Gemmatimonadales bacterium]
MHRTRPSEPASSEAPAQDGPGPVPTALPDPTASAHERARHAAARAEVLEARLAKNSRWRIGAFLLLVVPLLLLETSPRDFWPALFSAAGVGGVAFLLLVRRHRRLRGARDAERLRETLNHEALARIGRRWSEAPLPLSEAPPGDHACAADLNLLGSGSLAHLLGRANTGPGRAALRRGLLDPLAPLPRDPEELLGGGAGGAPDVSRLTPAPTGEAADRWIGQVKARQAAVDRLAGEVELREEMELATRRVQGRDAPERTLAFVRWAGAEPWLPARPGLLWGARGLVLVNGVGLALWFVGMIPALWILTILATWFVNRRVSADAHARFAAAEGGEGDPMRWSGLLEAARRLPSDDPTLARLAGRNRESQGNGRNRESQGVGEAPAGAVEGLRALRRITDLASVRFSGLVYHPLAALTAWDVHVLQRLERWQESHGRAAGAWILTVAEVELLLALAGLRAEHPEWAFPRFRESTAEGLQGDNLGHPLLGPDVVVGNDVEVPHPNRLLLVTGSNMAGKTTLLRALGANQILALLGAPVCADRYVTAPIVPWTAMRVQDSVGDGVSLFMAELQRLRRVVDAAREGPVLFLLDEILQGTNTAERRTAARIVLGHLLETESVGAVTTHDLTLAAAEELKERTVDIHFREEVVDTEQGRRLDFDYRLRPGPATSKNALLLLEIVGLGPREGSSP